MPRINGTTNAQTSFLRAFRDNPAGPPPDAWPSPAILRRWLRRPAFLRALASLRDALRFQADMHLTSSAATASRSLSDSSGADAAPKLHNLSRILRLSHLRQRFEADSTSSFSLNPELEHLKKRIKRLKAELADAAENDIRNLPPDRRLSEEELHELAWRSGYSSPLKNFDHFPPPTPLDAYYKIIQDPSAILWYMDQYDKSGNDHRYSPILSSCRDIIPREHPNLRETFPRLANSRAT